LKTTYGQVVVVFISSLK